MRYLLALFAAAALIVPSVTAAGGFATVGIDPLPDGAIAGAPWTPNIFVKQHGRTPLGGLQPVVTVTNDGSGAVETFRARETSETGVYTADVIFPSAGEWRLEVDSGFGDSRLTYGPFTVAAPAAIPGGTSFPTGAVVAALALLGLAVAALLATRRLRRPRPAGA